MKLKKIVSNFKATPFWIGAGFSTGGVVNYKFLEFISSKSFYQIGLCLFVGVLVLLGSWYLWLCFVSDKEENENIKSDIKDKKINILFLINICLGLVSFFVNIYLYLDNQKLTNEEYQSVIFEGNINRAKDYFESFSVKKEFNSSRFEDIDRYYPSLLMTAITSRTPNYQKLVELAIEHNFSFNDEVTFSLLELRKKRNIYNSSVYTFLHDYISKKYPVITASQYLLGFTLCDKKYPYFTLEELKFLENAGCNIEEGLKIRYELLNYLTDKKYKEKIKIINRSSDEPTKNKNKQDYKNLVHQQDNAILILTSYLNSK